MQKIDGGYLILKTPFVRTGWNKHTAAMDAAVPQVILDAVNAVQRTAWRRNRIVFEVASAAWRAGDTIAGLPSPENLEIPERLEDAKWKAMTPEEIVKHKTELAMIHGENARMQSVREETIRKLQLAEELGDRSFWHVHTLDFRGRCYPVTQDLHPQGDDLCKGLHEFAEGKPLGKTGAYWLASRLASNYGNGMDKAGFDERFEWAKANSERIVACVSDPLDGNRFWLEAEEPWQFLAAANEWAQYKQRGDDFVSYLSVNLDGSINGAQHLSALGRDPVGARLTNMTAEPKRQDLYSDVCAACVRRIEADALNGIEEAKHWIGKVTRTTVKRGVMTTPYGVTDRGLRDQLIVDKHTKGLEGNQIANANYFKTVLAEAIGECVVGARRIMGFLQGAAKAAAEKNLPFEWTGPLGMKVRQAYYKRQVRRVDTLVGRLQIWEENEGLGLSARKQELAASPNFVHHMDAMHLYRTVLRAKSEGINSFLCVHDSYGTHAADIGRVSRLIREEFVALYQEDHLERLAEELRGQGVDVPAIPERGTFDVREVLDAPFFFS